MTTPERRSTDPDPEPTLLSALLGMSGKLGGLNGRFDEMALRLDADRRVQQERHLELKKSLELHDHRLGILERLAMVPDRTLHLASDELVDHRDHMKDADAHLSPEERVFLNRLRTQGARRWKLIGGVGGGLGSLVAVATYLSGHWPF